MEYPEYTLEDTSRIYSPALLVFRDLVEQNIQKMIQRAGGPDRLRPHCKTHKMPEVTELELKHGITRHKAATLAEVEMLAQAGVTDIFLAYNLVGPNIQRAVRLLQKYPDMKLAVTADHPKPLRELSAAMSAAGLTVQVLLDLDCGMHRTGIAAGPDANALYQLINDLPGIEPGGIHAYDGHQKAESFEDRARSVREEFAKTLAFRDELVQAGLSVPRIVAGGTPTFPVYATIDEPTLELSPGTCVFHDAGYGNRFTESKFTPAAVLLTRVISRPTKDRITLDLGSKAVASDPPAGQRLVFPTLPDAEHILQNEEHLVLKTDQAEKFQPGDTLIAVPVHVCPTSALHKAAYVISGGQVVGRWMVVGRDREITI